MDLEAAADRARAEHVAAQARVDEANRALRTAAGRKAAADKSTAEVERETKRLQAEAQAKLLELSSLRETARLMDGAAARELQAVERAAASADEKHKWAQRRVLQDEAAMLETLVDMLRAVSDEDASALAAVGEVVFQFAKYELSWEWLAEGGTAKAEEMRSSVATAVAERLAAMTAGATAKPNANAQQAIPGATNVPELPAGSAPEAVREGEEQAAAAPSAETPGKAAPASSGPLAAVIHPC